MIRPRGVTIIGCLLIIQGLVLGVAAGLVILTEVSTLAEWMPEQVISTVGAVSAGDWIGIGLYALVATLMLLGGIALLMMRPWAWTLAMLLQGYALTLNLWNYFHGYPLYLQMFLTVVIVFYLNSQDVYRAFQASRRSQETQAFTISEAPDASEEAPEPMAPLGIPR